MRRPDPDRSAAPAPLLLARRFLPLFLVQALGAFNDNVFKNAFLALLTFSLIDQLQLQMSLVTLTSIAAAVFILPFALFAPFAGQIADRVDKAAMMRAVKFVEIVLMALAALAYHWQSLPFLYALLFLMGAQSAMFSPIKYGVLPQYLPDDELVQGNGLTQAATFLAILLGTIAGFQLMKTDAGITLVSIAVVAVAIIGFIASLYAPPAPPAPAETAGLLDHFGLRLRPIGTEGWIGLGVFTAIAIGLAAAPYLLIEASDALYGDRLALALGGLVFAAAVYALWPSIDASIVAAKERPVVWSTILAISWFWFAAASFMTLLPALVKQSLGGDEDVLTLLLACFSIGVGIGASLVSKIQQGRIEVGVAPVGALGIAVFAIDLYVGLGDRAATQGAALIGIPELLSAFSGWRVLIDFIGLAICAGLYVTPLNAVYQHNAPPEAIGRVVAASNMMDSAFMAFSSVVIILLQSLLAMSPQAVMAAIGATGLLATLVTARWAPERRLGRWATALWPPRDRAR